MRRATPGKIRIFNDILDFYPRSPCGERRVHYDNYNLHCVISIHALLAESDRPGLFFQYIFLHFYPRSPCGERPLGCSRDAYSRDFYPRSPCGERRLWTILYSCPGNFYPRSPCGERLSALAPEENPTQFLSTLSLRRATIALLIQPTRKPDFYPRSPCGERLIREPATSGDDKFLSTLSLRRATNDAINGCNPDFISIHALLAESDSCRIRK